MDQHRGKRTQRLIQRYQCVTVQDYPSESDEETTGGPYSMTTSTSTSTPLVLNIDPLKYIERLPDFDGKSEEIFSFLELVEEIIPLILRYDTGSQRLLLNRIKSKLRGKAREIIEINNHVQSWSEIRSVLISSFGDKKSCFQIFDELRAVSFNTHSVELYNKIKSILRRLNNKSKDQPNPEFNAKANKLAALNIFKDKLPEPMRSILFCRKPETLEEALDILIESNYAYYNPFKSNPNQSKNPRIREQTNPQIPTRNNNNHHNLNRQNPNNTHNQTYNNLTRNNHRSHYNSSYSQPNRSQNSRQNQHSYPDPNLNANNNRPEPMDVDTSTNSRINSVEVESVENFQLVASENSNSYLI